MTQSRITLASIFAFAAVAGMIFYLVSNGEMPAGLGAIAAIMGLVAIIFAARALR
jgi:hypothetical protein